VIVLILVLGAAWLMRVADPALGIRTEKSSLVCIDARVSLQYSPDGSVRVKKGSQTSTDAQTPKDYTSRRVPITLSLPQQVLKSFESDHPIDEPTTAIYLYRI